MCIHCESLAKPKYTVQARNKFLHVTAGGRVQLKCDGTRCRTGGEVKGKLANGVGNQYSLHYLGT